MRSKSPTSTTSWSVKRLTFLNNKKAGAFFFAAALGVAPLFLGGCGRGDYFWARHLEKSGRQEAALQLYLAIAEKRPESGVAPRALLRASRLATEVMGDHALARDLCLQIIDRYGARKDWSKKAELALFNSPNYFPLVDGGEWGEGDAASGGDKFLVQTTSRRAVDAQIYVCVRKVYLDRQFRKDLSNEVFYTKSGGELKESAGEGQTPAVRLKYPFTVGSRWSSEKAGRQVDYVIQSTGAVVDVKAGHFEGCLKVREDDPKEKAPHYIYYAPWVGRVLTTEAAGAGERRMMELISYDLANEDMSELGGLRRRSLFHLPKKKEKTAKPKETKPAKGKHS